MNIVHGIILGMNFLHKECNILHCDLAARNILMDSENNPKIGDFGLAQHCEGELIYKIPSTQKCPIPIWGPECFIKMTFTAATDVWSFGMLCYEVATNTQYVVAYDKFPKFMQDVTKGGSQIKDKIPTECPELLRDYINRCQEFDMERRPTFSILLGI